MNEVFSFSTNLIEAKIKDNIKILSKYKYNKNVTIKIESNIEHLNGFYIIKPNTDLILEFTLTENTELHAIKIWGAKWDFDGELDCEIKVKNNIEIENNIINLIKDVKSKTSHIIPNYYNKKTLKNIAFNKTNYTFKKSNDNTYYININKNINENELTLNNNSKFEIIKFKQTDIIINFNEIKDLDVILSITLDNIILNIPGQEILNIYDFEKAFNQIRVVLEMHHIKNVNISYHNEKINISNYTNKYSTIKFNGPIKSLIYKFSKSSLNKLKITHNNINNKLIDKIIINASDKYSKNICTLNIINNITNKHSLNYHIIDNYCYVELTSDIPYEKDLMWLLTTKDKKYFNVQTFKKNYTKLNWIINISDYDSNFDIICNSLNNYTLHKNIKIDKKLSKSIYYTINMNNKFAMLNIFSNKSEQKDFIFDFNILNNTISKYNKDFSIKQSNFKILKNKKYKQIKISWLNSNPIKDVKLKINDTIISIQHINKEYYPSNITYNNTKNDFKHVLNKLVNKELTLKYTYDNISDKIILPPNTISYTYKPKSNNMHWQVFDNDILIFEQDIFYEKITNEITVIYDNLIKYYNKSYIKINTSHIFNDKIKIKIESESNIGIDLNNEYIITSNKDYIKIPIIAKRKSSVGWVIFRIYSLSDNIIINNKKHIIMFN